MSSESRLYKIILEHVEVEKIEKAEKAEKAPGTALLLTTFSFEEVSSQTLSDEVISVNSYRLGIPAEAPLFRMLDEYNPERETSNYMSVSTASEQSGIPKSTLYKWCKEKKIKSIRDSQGQWWIKGTIKNAKKVGNSWQYNQVFD